MTSACSTESAFRFWLRELRYGAQPVLIRLLIAVDDGRDVLPHVATHQRRGLHGLDRRPRDHAAAVASPSRPDRRPGSCSSDSHGSLKRETQIDSIRSQSAYAAAIGTRQARTGSRPGRLSRMPECCDPPGGRCVYEFACKVLILPFQLSRKAAMGFTCVARYAGKQLASMATASKSRGTSRNTAGSWGRTP